MDRANHFQGKMFLGLFRLECVDVNLFCLVLGAFTIPTAITPTSGFSFNSAATNKVYFFANSGTSDFGTSDCPQDSQSGSYSLLETWGYGNWFKVQRFTIFGGYIYVRFYISNAWNPWKKFTAS